MVAAARLVMMLHSTLSRLGTRAAGQLSRASVSRVSSLLRPAVTSTAPVSLAPALQLPLRACFSSWLSGPRGRLGAAQSLGPNNRAEKEGEEEMQSSVSGPFFDISVFDVEQAMEDLLKPPPQNFILFHSFRTASLDDLLPPATEAVTEAGGMQLIKRTYQPSVVRRKRTHGFLSRLATRDGRKVLERRRRKGRARLAV